MEALSLEAEGESDRDELSGEELLAAFPATWRQEASVSCGLAKVYVLGLAQVGGSVCARLDTGGVAVHSGDTLVKTAGLTGHGGPVSGLCGGDTALLYTCSRDETVRLWDLREARTVHTLRDTSDQSKQSGPPGRDRGRPLSCVAVSSDGHTVVAGTDQVSWPAGLHIAHHTTDPGLEPSPTGPTSPTIDQTCLNRPTRPTNAPYVRS